MQITEVTKKVISLASIVRLETEVRENPTKGGYDPIRELREGREPTKAEKELREILINQPVAVIYTLTLLMYVGRGDFEVEDFLTQYQEMRDTFDKPTTAVDNLLDKLPLPDYLEKGLRLTAESGINVDNLL